MTNAPLAAGDAMENYFLLMDPEWEPEGDEEVPPIEAVIGLWPLDAQGSVGRFRSNPEYRPRYENSPADPTDALLRLAMRGDATMEQLQLILRDSLYDLALNGDGRPLIIKSPDDVPCVVIATSGAHRDRVSSPDWTRVDLMGLTERLADGIDVFLNPGGAASVRLTGSFIRETVMMSDEELAAAYEQMDGDARLTVIPWEIAADDPAQR
jgi:hypothetical protein